MARADVIVERALREYPKTRSNDRSLILCVWWLQKPDYQQNFNAFFMGSAIMPETITRCRRKIQEQGKYRASETVEQERYNKFNSMKNYGSGSVEEIGKIL